MLFDLRGRGRQNTVKVVYITLAFLMGGGLIFFGIGGNTSGGGLLDAFTGSGSSGDVGADRYRKEIAAAKKSLAANRRDEAAWSQLIGAQVNLAGTGEQFDNATNTYTEAGLDDLRDAVASWERFQAIDPRNEDEEARVAKKVVEPYIALDNLPDAVTAQEIVAINRDATGNYSTLAQLAYAAGQTRAGDLAAKKAIQLEDADQRAQLRSQLDQVKQQSAAAGASPTPSAAPSATAAPEGNGSGGKGKSKK